jgi:PAS domain S-box-containing protein
MKSTISDDEELSGMSTTDMQRTIHELRVHQIELQMQNDELRRIQQELEAAKDRYSNLYDFSPVGYLTVNEKGMIEVANLTFANLVGMDRSAVVGKPFSGFIQPEDQDVYYLHRRRLLDSGNFQSFRLKLAKNDGLDFYANVECMVIREIDSDLPTNQDRCQ